MHVSSIFPLDIWKVIAFYSDEKSLFQLYRTSKELNRIALEVARNNENRWEKTFIQSLISDLSDTYLDGSLKFGLMLEKVKTAFKNITFSKKEYRNLIKIKSNRDKVNEKIAKTFKDAIMSFSDSKIPLHETAFYPISMRLGGVVSQYLSENKIRESEIVAYIIPVDDYQFFSISNSFIKLAWHYFKNNNLNKALNFINQAPNTDLRALNMKGFVGHLCDKKDFDNAHVVVQNMPEKESNYKMAAEHLITDALVIKNKSNQKTCVIS